MFLRMVCARASSLTAPFGRARRVHELFLLVRALHRQLSRQRQTSPLPDRSINRTLFLITAPAIASIASSSVLLLLAVAPAMATPNHHGVINASPADDATFPRFQELPPELRLAIWEHAVPSQRTLVIKIFDVKHELDGIEILDADGENPDEHVPMEACEKIMTSGVVYAINVASGELYNRLMHVTSEARKVALQYCRIHMPCIFVMSGARYGQFRKLYLNPEHDVIRFSIDRFNGSVDSVMAFISDLRTIDPDGGEDIWKTATIEMHERGLPMDNR